MKIVLVVQSFPALSETFIVNKFIGLWEQGIDVHIVCNNFNRANWGKFPQLNKRNIRQHIHVNPPVNPRWRMPLLLIFYLLRCMLCTPRVSARYLFYGRQQFGFDILRRFYLDAPIILQKPTIIHFEFGAQAVGRMYLKSLLKCKITVSFRGYDINYVGLEDPNYYAEIWNTADQLHFLGHDLHRRAIRRGCPPKKPSALIPPAINVEYFVPNLALQISQYNGRAVRILSVGRMEWKKGYEFALQAVKQLNEMSDKPIEYRIAGDGNLFEALHFCRHQLGLENQVIFLGAVPHSQVLEEMENADIFLHAAVSEGFCNAVMEAQAMKLPVVTSDADGLAENVEDGITGFVVPRRSPNAMAEKLLLLVQNPELRAQMGEAGRERVKAHFDLKDQVQAFVSMYQGVCETS